MTDVGALMRGLNADDLERMERVLIEADFGVPATVELTQALEDEVRRGKLKTEADLQRGAREPARRHARRAGAIPASIARAEPGPRSSSWSASTAPARPPPPPSSRAGSSARAARSCWPRPTPIAPGAIAQLQVWAERLGLPCVAGAPGGDPASVAFDAIDAAVSRGLDTVIIDTAGRLHTQEGLMDELRKVVRVVGRRLPGAPHETLLVLDGTVGQNAIQQGKLFAQAVSPTGHRRHQARRQRPRRRGGGAPAGARPARSGSSAWAKGSTTCEPFDARALRGSTCCARDDRRRGAS